MHLIQPRAFGQRSGCARKLCSVQCSPSLNGLQAPATINVGHGHQSGCHLHNRSCLQGGKGGLLDQRCVHSFEVRYHSTLCTAHNCILQPHITGVKAPEKGARISMQLDPCAVRDNARPPASPYRGLLDRAHLEGPGLHLGQSYHSDTVPQEAPHNYYNYSLMHACSL